MTVTANNDTFARMLVIELKYMGIDAKISDSVSPDDRFAIVDLDFTENIHLLQGQQKLRSFAAVFHEKLQIAYKIKISAG